MIYHAILKILNKLILMMKLTFSFIAIAPVIKSTQMKGFLSDF